MACCGRYLPWIAAAIVLLVAVAFVALWIRLRETPLGVAVAVVPAAVSSASITPQVIRLWPGKAPGSESWSQREVEIGIDGERYARNVVDPTITAYFPPAGNVNGTAMVVCPGGGFRMLTLDREGADVARDLNAQGITAFVLRYRLTRTSAAFMALLLERLRGPRELEPDLESMTPLILADGQQAIRVIRSHAAEWGLRPDRIGMIGFSAGAYLALHVALHHDAESAPNFVAALYPMAPDPLTSPPEKIPLFLLAAEDDPNLSPAENAVRICTEWRAAGAAAELHLFAKGGHGFGIRRQGLPVDTWPDLLHAWLASQGYLSPGM